ncbi:SUMF1/EgtB/PvdO family nonheme iron enzyme [Estrella lausannensis]|uniref:non-specific serine/threonine protein kinase n=1 Tax=Estrella lausannensis TaxID=483423 RepID=A0A0H5DQ50_9BACT|nr:SUMF1/EgtB/PvdO family nonheme iron enzyme [Estrella lausannensis]CRX37654.1 putative serine/threonine-protein kinase [Estrella lausannensis]
MELSFSRSKYSAVFSFWLLLLLASILLPKAQLQSSQDKGLCTLVVTYNTGEDRIRLDRVRFWLISERGDLHLYPQGNSYVDDPETSKRMVLIENLPEGAYTLKFIMPNSDGLFEKVEPRKVSLVQGGVVKVDQELKLLAKEIGSQPDVELAYESPYQREAPPMHEVRFYSQPFDSYAPQPGYLNIRSNVPAARWVLYKDGARIASGEGSVKDLTVPAGSGYQLTAEELENYEVKLLPQTPFSVQPNQTQSLEIFYKRILGVVQVMTDMPTGDALNIQIEGSALKQPLRVTQVARSNKIEWTSPGIPLGNYVISFKPPSFYEEITPVKFSLKQGQNALIRPKLRGGGKILVITNTSDATFTLKQTNGPLSLEGSGDQYRFEGLLPGNYTLTFSSKDPTRYIPPKSLYISLSRFRKHEETVEGEYTFAGMLKITGNIARFSVKLEPKSGNFDTIREEVTDYSKSIPLPEGNWKVIFTPIGRTGAGTPLPAKEIYIDAFATESITPVFEEKVEKQEPAVSVTETPRKTIDELYKDLIFVPAGLSIFGDPYRKDTENTFPAQVVELSTFEISKYEVTNGQFCDWLNIALQEGSIRPKDNQRGVFTNVKGNVVFRTMEANADSQISFRPTQDKVKPFMVLPGFDNYPVIHVTWIGAQEFCNTFGLRLPTEAEWERAASVRGGNNVSEIKKWIYGFSKDVINRSLANYKSNPGTSAFHRVATTPVGFYNGVNTIPLSPEDLIPKKTEDAKSPIGAYDMSGNVFEWVQDWYFDSPSLLHLEKNPLGPLSGSLKVAKGGCYDSLADGVRSFERIALAPEHSDSFTGFRVARTTN